MTRPLMLSAIAFAGLLIWAGCKPNKPASSDTHPDAGDKHTDAHAETGPHDGHLIELGEEEYHAELTHDDASKTVTIYVLDSSAKLPVPIEATEITVNMVIDKKPEQFKLAASRQDDDPDGQSSRFSSSDEKLFDVLEAGEASGRFNVSIKGKSYTGSLEHHDHEGEEHEEET